MQKDRDTSGQDPEGGVPVEGSAKRSRREAPQPPRSGGWEGGTHVYPWVTVERCLQRGAEKHGQDRVLSSSSLREKG